MRPLQPTCSFDCAIVYGLKVLAENQQKREREKARAHREAKIKAKPRSKWMAEAQAAFNRFIRARDYDKPCISCGRYHDGQWQAGHYRTTKAAPELRFIENNVHKQCAPCNNHLSGNIVLYRKGLISKIGIELVEWLEGKHEAKHYTVDDLKQIKTKYTALAKELA